MLPTDNPDEKPDLSKLTPDKVDAYLNTIRESSSKDSTPGKRLVIVSIIFLVIMVAIGLLVMSYSPK